KSFMPRKDNVSTSEMVKETLKVADHKMVNETTNQNMRDNLSMDVKEAIKLENEKTKADIASMVADAGRKEHECTRATLLS
nr:hypothetical protein [Tanacetum cinerariifolium]